jgi:UDP-glucose:(heptosyl)LPS alpha-1,3-glucosyltransferase
MPLLQVDPQEAVATAVRGTSVRGRLRIAFVVHDYHRQGGHARYVAELAHRFRRQHEVHVFSNTFDEPDPAGIVHHYVPAWRANALATILSFVVPATWQVRRGFDIVHAQGFCGLRQNVVTAHMCQAAWFQAVDRNSGPQPWRKRMFRAVTTRLEQLAYRERSAKAFIAVSERARQDLEEHHRLRRVRVIHHGVDVETFHPRNRLRWRADVRAALGLGDSEFVALYVGDWQKAGAPLLASLAHTPHVRLVVVTRTATKEILQAAASLGVADRLMLAPPTSHIERWYAAADAFVFPSFYDTFGMVVAEAMAAGLPVIVSRAAGAAEWVVPGVNGLLLDEAWDGAALSREIVVLRDDSALRNQLGGNARRTAEEHTWDRVAEETLEVYRDVLAEPRT